MPTDDELRDKSQERDDAVERTAEGLNEVGDSIGTARDLAGDARDYDARITGILGALLDQDVDTFQYTADALDNFGDAMTDHVSNLESINEKLDRNRREVLFLTGGIGGITLLGADFLNANPGFGPIPRDGSYDPRTPGGRNKRNDENDWDAWGLSGEQGYEPHVAAEGAAPGGAEQIIEETIEREHFPEVFRQLRRSYKPEVMSPQNRERLFDDQGYEFVSVDVDYYSNDREGSVNVGYIDLSNIEGASSFEEVSDSQIENHLEYSGEKDVDSEIALELTQIYDEVTGQ